MKRIISVVPLILALLLTGCANVDNTNRLIADANRDRAKAYADGMAACGTNAACQVGLTALVAGGLGQQQFIKPDTAIDWLREGRMWLDPVGRIVDRVVGASGTSGDHAGSHVRGDGNTILIGNRSSADQQSVASFLLNPSYTRSYDGGGNRDYTGLQPITDEGLQ